MKHRLQYFLTAASLLLTSICSIAQNTTIYGQISSSKEPVAFATVYIPEARLATTADADGKYELRVAAGTYSVVAKSQGFLGQTQNITGSKNQRIKLDFSLVEDALGLEEVVVSATRNRVERKKTPVVVSSIKPRLLTATQSITLADGLNYAPGVRMETNCQNCGFTQVRLNGLDGGYTQILLNSRPIFSSLIGVYGLEQIPTNIIDRVEVVRSGGSALYGSNAIAGTVNVITKDPVLNSWEVGSNFALIDGETLDRNFTLNTAIVADNLKSGATIYGTSRTRGSYDANDDGFSEIVKLRNTTVGTKAFLKPNDRSRISLNLNAIREYRRGGDRLELAPQFTDITEELDHDTFLGGLEYDISTTDHTKTFQVYTSASYTNRASYYGGLGGGRTAQDSITANNAFGSTEDLAWVNGVQITNYLKNNDILTAGIEYNITDTEDIIPGYNRLIDQNVHALGAYGQYEWQPNTKLTALIGTRLDHIVVDGRYKVGNISRRVDISQTALSPRLTLSYLITEALRLRGGYARGFRAPQAFNEDLHISSVGGEPQFVILSNNLEAEFSNAYTGSLNYSKTIKLLQVDFLIEGFYTELKDPFTVVSTGASLENGSILEEVRNGENARVFGANFEFGISPNPKWRFQLGGTLQRTKYDQDQLLYESDGSPNETDITIDKFVRVPNLYGYLNGSWLPSKKFNIDVTGTYTGSMTIPLVINDNGFLQLNEVDPFFDLNLKFEKHVDLNENFMITFSAGIRNIFNSYQDDFDSGAQRDSDYIYGPNLPRTFFFGLKFGKWH